ncbi:hypothetical protein JRO89_XS13G0257400 [Xanthoceras sorbifolium]|uniref:Uncharacterized protein n=1 Tax=Xanthoceras sorbifolium TaxID=99658 RepID=A0ABQ8H9Y6_9ROSI|nr:hypothetical protein JRO89_XS13G0257400 [Xanthoceras sorbifolium]
MYQTQYPIQPPSFTYLSHQPTNPNPNPDPNSYVSYPQPAVHFAETAVHPPGTDPYVNPGPYTLTHLGYEGQTQYYEDSNDGSANWVTRQADPIRYESGSLASTGLNSSWNSYWTNQPLMNNVTNNISKQLKVIQPMRCDVCKIDCNSKDVFEKHISGKKHQRNMQTHLNSTSATLQNSYSMVNNASLPSQIGIMNGRMISGASSMGAGQELEKKKQKLLGSGTAVDSVRICTICNVACNGEEVFSKHLSGKKHAAQAGLMALNGVGQYFAEIKAQNNSFWSGVHKKTKVVQSAWCEVCKINCNSNDVYVKHLQGKKHQKNLENLESKNGTATSASSAATIAANPIIGPMENTEANKSMGADSQKKRAAQLQSQSQSTVEDLETKKRKVVESGAAAGDVRVCTVCNVVCNSQTVFKSHIAGQKHAAMVKKQGEGLSESGAPLVVYAT